MAGACIARHRTAVAGGFSATPLADAGAPQPAEPERGRRVRGAGAGTCRAGGIGCSTIAAGAAGGGTTGTGCPTFAARATGGHAAAGRVAAGTQSPYHAPT